MRLTHSFYGGNDVVKIARDLLGKVIVVVGENKMCSGMICETEAYAGITDRASHAWNGRKSERTKVMYGRGGLAYIYLCYGVHSLFNVVTNGKGIPDAVLVRAIIPIEGIATMTARLKRPLSGEEVINGPGKLTKALGLHFSQSGIDLNESKEIWIEDRRVVIDDAFVRITPRIGIDYAGVDALRPYRFVCYKK